MPCYAQHHCCYLRAGLTPSDLAALIFPLFIRLLFCDLQQPVNILVQTNQKKKQQEAVAMNGLGYLFYHGLGGVPQDLSKAFECFDLAQSQDKENNPNILFNLGLVSGRSCEHFVGTVSYKVLLFPMEIRETRRKCVRIIASVGFEHTI